MTVHARALALIAMFTGTACATTTERPSLAPAVFAGADSVASTTIVPGVTHTFARDPRGPWAIHVIEVDARRCEPLLEARKPGASLGERATTSALTRDALAGINADFFMLPGGTPVGAHVTGGEPLIGPGDRPVFAVTAAGPARAGWRIGTATIRGHALVRTDSAAIAQVNRRARATSAYRGTADGLTLFTSWIGDSVPADSSAVRVVLRVLAGGESNGRGVLLTTGPAAEPAAMSPGTAVLHARGDSREWVRRHAPGDTIQWRLEVTMGSPGVQVREAVGGFPMLLAEGREVLAEQTVNASFSRTRHPRSAIGWTPDDRLLLVVVDGRQPEWSVGMSLDEMTWLFRSLGASDALNLDGGGSTAMVIGGAAVNRPSDREGERAVGNALVLTGCR